MNKWPRSFLGAAIIAFCVFCGCTTNKTSINEVYQIKDKVLDLGGTHWTRSLLGRSGPDGSWTELWPSIPYCYEGETWLQRGTALVFIGWAKDAEKTGDRRLLVTHNASPPIDITDAVLAGPLKERQISPTARFGEDYMFMGLVAEGENVFVVTEPETRGAGFSSTFRIPVKTELIGK